MTQRYALQSFRLLLYLEWILLGFAGLSLILVAHLLPIPEFVPLAALSVAALGAMRLRLPTQPLLSKVLYTGLEFLILLLPTLLNSHIVGPMRFNPLLGLVVVVRSCQMFELPGRLVVAGLTFTSFVIALCMGKDDMFVVNLFRQKSSLAAGTSNTAVFTTLQVNAAITFGLAIMFVLLLINALLEERQSREKLAIAHEQLQRYALRIEDQSALHERNRIAREIHDSLGHTLTAQSIQLDSALLLSRSNLEQSNLFLKEAKQLCTQALREVRQSVTTLRLRTDPLQGKSLETAIASLVEDFRTTTAVEPDCTLNVTQPLSPETITTIYRILQEALTNIIRHSAATKVTIHMFERDQSLCLLIIDDGKGFDPLQNSTGFGLQGMQERALILRGQFNLQSSLGEGCRISVQLPLAGMVL
jgi:signal transduction histidine kinase